ncbi:lipid A biosynthesis acyltransferase [Polynucleobacter sp. JS-Fieb-80-E5]|nr:lipid A biosynthesis acyltransferase [Polynucleobacter sp. JS-Fieb-80-E5]
MAAIQIIGAGTGVLVYLFSSRYRRRLYKNHLSAAHYSGFKSTPWRVAAESGMMFADTLWIWRHPKSSITKVSIEHLDQVIELSKNGKGLIVLASHLGGFEIVPRIFAEHTRATVMYRPARKRWVNELMLKSRKHTEIEFVEANLGGVRQIKRALIKGEVVGLLADQVPSIGDGVWAKFFNQYAYTTSFPIKLARQVNVAILFVGAERLGLGKGWLIKSQLMNEAFPDCLVDACTEMNHYFEEMILSKPHQYMWSYNRYKRPAGAELAPTE